MVIIMDHESKMREMGLMVFESCSGERIVGVRMLDGTKSEKKKKKDVIEEV
jgi:hypothetical protein